MTLRHVAILVSNVVVLVATQIAFGAWIEHGLGYFDLDFIGLSWHAWVPVVVVATAFAWLAARYVWARIAAWAAVTFLVLLMVDHALGALRDGDLSPAGALVGALMVGQVAILGLSLAVAGSPRPTVVGAASIVMLALAAVIGVAIGLASMQFAGSGPKEAAVGRWMNALSGAPDRGWSLLDEVARSRTSFEEYRADAASVDWETVDWRVGATNRLSTQWYVSVVVEGGLEGVPAFLLDDRIVQPDCLEAPGAGFILYVETPFFADPKIGPGAWTGSAERAADDRACPSPEPMPTPAVRWDDEGELWTGFTLEAWNRTTLDLFLQDRDGRRVGLPACGRASTSLLDLTQFEIRAAGGYVATIGMGTAEPERTQFVVVLADFPEVNGAPPSEPLPPCEGRPQVQPGV
jgi:hypothetical protein